MGEAINRDLMKQVIITIKYNITEKGYNSEKSKELKNSIESGKLQRDILKEKEISNVTTTFITQ